MQELLRLTRNTELCTPVHFDFNHERIVVEKSRTMRTGSRSNVTFNLNPLPQSRIRSPAPSKREPFVRPHLRGGCLRSRLGEFFSKSC